MMGRVQEEAIRLIGVGFTDVFIRSQTVEGFEALGIVVGVDESAVMRDQASQARLTMLDRPTHCRRRAGAPM
jgi:hypothetical protein